MAATQSVIGDYRLVARIGGGAMGGVYRAVYQPTGAEVAIKLLPPDLAADPVACGYFRRGAASAAALRHPNILTAWHHGEYAGSPYLIMPLVRGGTLRDRIARGPLAPAEALGYLRQLAAALDYAHSQGVIHRDVKPANLLLDGRGHLYLADFGIARALESATRFTDTGEGVGTPDYMAPEQARGHADGRSDLYAAAIILYQMLTGRVPFGGASAIEALLRHLQDPLPVLPLREARLALPPAIEGVLLRALAKDPDARYQRGADLVAAVEDAFAPPRRVEQRPPVAAVVPPPVALPRPVAVPVAPQPVAWPQSPRQPARHGTALVGFSVALAVALLFGSAGGVGAWFVLPRFDPMAATKPVVLFDPTPTATVAPSPSPRPSPSPSPSPSAPPAPPTATPTPLPKTGPYTIPAGWRTYTGDLLPFAIAYPPTWTVEEHLADRYVLFQSPDPNVWLEILTFGKEKQGTTIDGERDNFNNAFRDACERAGVEETFNNTVSGLIFAALLATCDLNGKLYAYYIGAALYEDVPWYYVTFSPYGSYADNANAYFDPMLDSLNIYASR